MSDNDRAFRESSQRVNLPSLASLIAIILGICFQLQATLAPFGADIRVSLADFVAPFALVIMLVHVLTGRSSLPAWRLHGLYLWLAALSAWLAVALYVGYVATGGWQSWALINKFAGWFVLLCFFGLGGWIGGISDDAPEERFLRSFLLTGWIICAISLIAYVLVRADGSLATSFIYYQARLQGCLENPNAFGSLVAIQLVIQAPFLARGQLFTRWAHRIGGGVALAALVLSFSRSAWLGGACGIAALIVLRAIDVRESMKIAALALVLVVVALKSPGLILAGIHSHVPLDLSERLAMNPEEDVGISDRLAISLEAVRMWWDAPLLGAGLGTFLWKQIELGTAIPYVVHNSFLWLLTETGLIGACLFVTFYVLSLRALIGRRGSAGREPLQLAVFAAMIAFAGVSMGMEAIYQRHLWFLLGCGLALPAVRPRIPRQTFARLGKE